MKLNRKICYDCKRKVSKWNYDGSYTKRGREYQKYCCEKCWYSRSYYVWNFEIKNPRPHGIIKL